MKPKVLIYKNLSSEMIDLLYEYCEVHYEPNLNVEDKDTLKQKLYNIEGLLGSGLNVNKDLLDLAPKLKIVSNISVGYDNLDIDELSKREIQATNTPDVLTDTTADLLFGLILSTARRIPEMNRFVKNKQWNETISERHFGVDVHHKVLGIIGMGRIGTAIAKRAKLGFDMEVQYTNRSRNLKVEESLGVKYVQFDELLYTSDFICLMTPLTRETHHMISKKEFKKMKNTAIFINGSRGGTVNEKDLIDALNNKEILAAGLDVFENEPLEKNNPLLKMDNVVILPHIGSATKETRDAMAKCAIDNIIDGLTGKRPANLINNVF